MRRRALLGGASGLVVMAGCVGRMLPDESPVAETQFRVYDGGADFYAEAPGAKEPPRITFDTETPHVDIVGKLIVGSSTCDKAALTDLAYDADSDTLRVKIGSGEKPNASNSCSGDESADAYHARITFQSRLPKTVIATETGDLEDRQTTAHSPGTN